VKITRFLVLVALFGFTCSVALADGTDPVMKLGGGTNSEVLTTNTFSFSFTQTSPPQTSIFVDFINDTHTLITELDLLITGSPGLVFSCDNTIDPYFAHCGTSVLQSGQYDISFFGLDASHHGIPFAVEVECDDGSEELLDEGTTDCEAKPALSDFGITVAVGDMTAGQSFTAAGTLVAPEPSSLVLLFVGGLLFLLYRRTAFAQ
jgi:hypothetical protein